MAEIARQPKYIAAGDLAGAISYGVMNFLMTSTPIAMQRLRASVLPTKRFVISSHVVAMFAPSFLTGPLIKRAGTMPVMLAGAALNVCRDRHSARGGGGRELSGGRWYCWAWAGTSFISAPPTLLTETYRPEERAKAQGANEFAIFAMMALSSFSSGMIVTNAGWDKVNYAADSADRRCRSRRLAYLFFRHEEKTMTV